LPNSKFSCSLVDTGNVASTIACSQPKRYYDIIVGSFGYPFSINVIFNVSFIPSFFDIYIVVFIVQTLTHRTSSSIWLSPLKGYSFGTWPSFVPTVHCPAISFQAVRPLTQYCHNWHNAYGLVMSSFSTHVQPEIPIDSSGFV